MAHNSVRGIFGVRSHWLVCHTNKPQLGIFSVATKCAVRRSHSYQSKYGGAKILPLVGFPLELRKCPRKFTEYIVLR